MFHALGRYGVTEATIFDDLAPFSSEADLELLRKNSKAAFYEPLVGAAAHALAAVLDRVRHGTLPASVARDAIVQQAATLAASLAAQPRSLAGVPRAPARRTRRGDAEGARARGDRARLEREVALDADRRAEPLAPLALGPAAVASLDLGARRSGLSPRIRSA